MHRIVRLTLSAGVIGLAACSLVEAQSATPELAFETASIRPSQQIPGCASLLPSGSTHYTITCFSLGSLIAMAWKVDPQYVVGSDPKTLEVLYDVRATTPGDKPWTEAQIPPMLRRLLIERFHVRVHAGTKQVSGYGLLVAKGGPKLTAVKAPVNDPGLKAFEGAPNFIMPGYLQGRAVTLADIAGLLSSPAHEPVVDHTGIPGHFDVNVSFAPDNSTDTSKPGSLSRSKSSSGCAYSRKRSQSTLL